MANTSSPTPILTQVPVRHAALPALHSLYFNVSGPALPSSTGQSLKLVASFRRPFASMIMATETELDAKPIDVLNGDTTSPAGQAAASLDPESDDDIPLEEDELKDALGRPPPVNSSYLPLPWKGRLGYVSYAALHT